MWKKPSVTNQITCLLEQEKTYQFITDKNKARMSVGFFLLKALEYYSNVMIKLNYKWVITEISYSVQKNSQWNGNSVVIYLIFIYARSIYHNQTETKGKPIASSISEV